MNAQACSNDRLSLPKGEGFRSALWSAVMLIVAAAASFPRMVIHPNSADSSMFVWMGRRMLAGDLPYRDMWDNKLPVLYWLNSLAALTGRPNIALWVMLSAAVGVGGMMIFAIGRRFFSTAAAGLAALTYVTLACSPSIGETGNLTEVWAAPFAILSIYAMVRLADSQRGAGTWALVSGFGLATAACLRPPAGLLVVVLFALLPTLYRAGRLSFRSAGLWLVGFAVMPALMSAWALATGVFQPMWQDCILFNISYGSGAARPDWATWGHVAESFQEIITDTWPWHVVATIGLFLLLVGPARGSGDPGNPRSPLRAGSFCVMTLAWLVSAIVSALPGLRLYPHHYYLTIGPLALLSLWAWQYVAQLPSPSAVISSNVAQPPPAVTRRQRLGAVAVLLGAAALVGLHYSAVWKSALRQQERRAYLSQGADYLQSAGKPGQTMFLFGWGAENELYAQLGWRCSTRHPMALFYPEMPGGGNMLAQWQDELTRQPADWLVCTPRYKLDPPTAGGSTQPDEDDPFEPMRQFWRTHYRYDRSFLPAGPAAEGLLIYRLKDSARSPSRGQMEH